MVIILKKISLLILILLLFSGCHNNSKENNITNTVNTDNITIEEEKYIDDNPIKVSLYNNYNKINSYSTTLSNFKDIGVFNIYFTNIDNLNSNNIKDNYLKYYNEYKDINDYKIGFYISFYAEDKLIEELILDPSKKHAMTPYLYIYLYDDIHQEPGTYYSHLEPEDINDDTIYSSIKLFLAQEGIKITSPINLTVFTYNDEEDFLDNKYRGNSSYTIEIETK